MYYLIEKNTGNIKLRGTAPLRPNKEQVLVESAERLKPSDYVYDFNTRSFVKRPTSDILATRRAGIEKKTLIENKAAQFAKTFSEQDEDIQQLICGLMEIPFEYLQSALAAKGLPRTKPGPKKRTSRSRLKPCGKKGEEG